MKKFSQIGSKNSKKALDVQKNTINFINKSDLRKYLEIADKFLCDETKELINYLIVNNDNYINDLAPADADNALEYFYNHGPYKEEHFKEIYMLIGKINKMHRILEIPVFLTKEQFNGIINKEIAPDQVIMDLETEAGRNAVAKKYAPLCRKMANDWYGKSNLELEDLLSAAYEGLTWAMNNYGKKSNKAVKKELVTGEELDIEAYKNTTFMTFASYSIRFLILDAIKNTSQTVRIPANKQAEEREKQGYNNKNNTISGDKVIGNGEKGEKTLFDLYGGSENAGKDVDDEDIKTTWDMLMDRLVKSGKFSKKILDIWMEFNELNGIKKRKNKEIADELGMSPANVTYYCTCVNNFIKTDSVASKLARELIVLYNESLQRYYDENDTDEPRTMMINDTSYDE